MKIAVDFDGTIAKNDYPKIGKPVPGAFEWLQKLQQAGAKIILWTMRSGRELDAAVEFVEHKGILLFGVNHDPTQHTWTKSPKAYAQLYIDDAALGCPLIFPENGEDPYVDWSIAGPLAMKTISDGE